MARLPEDDLKRILGRDYVAGLHDEPSRWEVIFEKVKKRMLGARDVQPE